MSQYSRDDRAAIVARVVSSLYYMTEYIYIVFCTLVRIALSKENLKSFPESRKQIILAIILYLKGRSFKHVVYRKNSEQNYAIHAYNIRTCV